MRDSTTRAPRVEPSMARIEDQRRSQGSLGYLTGLLEKAASSVTGEAATQRDKMLQKYGLNDDPGGDDDPSDDSDEEPEDNRAGDQWSAATDAAMMKLMKGMCKMWKSDEYHRAEVRRMQAESDFSGANQDALIQKAVPIIAAAITGLHELNVDLEREKMAVMRKMKEEERAYADKIEERKQDRALYPKANEVVQVARLIGDAGNNSQGGCGLQINPDNHGSAMYRELKVIANDPGAKEALKMSLTDSLIASLVGFKFGGAPKAGETELVYAGGASIYDGLRRLTKINDRTQRSFNAEPPNKGRETASHQ